ncbi:MAG: hypothetical protein ACETWM_11660 [Candidatus Lokiarchaeia archaeon]
MINDKKYALGVSHGYNMGMQKEERKMNAITQIKGIQEHGAIPRICSQERH